MKRRYFFPLVVAVCLANLAWAWLRQKHPASTLPPSTLSAESASDHTGGLPAIHRRRIDDYIESIAAADYETWVADLNKDEFLLTVAESRTHEMTFETTFQVCLANRRLAAIDAVLRERDPKSAAMESLDIFKTKFEILKADWEKVFFEWEEQGGCKKTFPLQPNYYAASAALFLVGQFSETGDLLSCVDAWSKYSEQAMSRVRARPDLEPLINECQTRACIESMFVLNLYLTHFTDRYGGTIQSLLESEGVPKSRSITIPMVAWDGHTNSFDFMHLHSNVPIDQNKILKRFLVFQSWKALGKYTELSQQELLASIRARLDGKSNGNTDGR